MVKKYYHRQIITCLIGDPVEHSVSDIMFEHFAKLTELENYKHLKLKISVGNKANLRVAIRAIHVFNMAGANITLPYKESVIQYLDSIDKTARFVGAVNTIVNADSKLIGYNTDGIGAIEAMETKLRPIKKTDEIVIFGAGGAARAIIGNLPLATHLTILSRASDLSQAKKLKKDFTKHNLKIEIRVLTDQNIISAIKEADFVVNATPVGMYPKNDNSIINKKHLNNIGKFKIKNAMFFDAVFNPFETKFLQLSKQYGAQICPGIYMMIYQGIQSFKLWTGKTVSRKSIEKVAILLKKTLKAKYKI